MDDEFETIEASASSTVRPVWRGVIENEMHHRWRFTVYPDACEVELANATGGRSVTFAVTQQQVLNAGAMLYEAMKRLSEDPQSYYGPPLREVRRRE